MLPHRREILLAIPLGTDNGWTVGEDWESMDHYGEAGGHGKILLTGPVFLPMGPTFSVGLVLTPTLLLIVDRGNRTLSSIT